MEVKRGDLVTIAIAGDYGKPRPALVIQDDAFAALESVVVLHITSELHDWPLLRINIEPGAASGLHKRSQIMIDKPAAVPQARIGQRIGHADPGTLQSVGEALVRLLGCV